MALRNWLRRLGASLQKDFDRKRRGRNGRRTSAASAVPCLVATEVLEDRTLLTAFVVDTNLDEGFGGGSLAVETADGGGLSLREAIGLANQNGGGPGSGDTEGDSITFALGASNTINLTQGELFILDDVSIDGTNGGTQVIIDAGGNSRIFNVQVLADSDGNGLENVLLSNLTLQNGDAGLAAGGAVLNATNAAANEFDATLTIDTVDFLGNAAGFGGALATTATNASADVDTLTVVDSVFMGNNATTAGGAVEITVGRATLTDVQIGTNGFGDVVSVGNTAGVNGGGVHITGAADVTIAGGSVSGNTAGQEGGGIWNSATGRLTLSDDENGTPGNDADDTNLAIQLNVANGNVDPTALGNTLADLQGGGGLFNNGGDVVIDGTIDSFGSGVNLQFNEARGAAFGSGGGILSVGGTVTVDFTLIRANEAVRAGGGIEVIGGTMILTSTNIQSNDTSNDDNLLSTGVLLAASPGNGAGIHISGDAVVTLDDVAVQDNVAQSEGGGIWNSGTGTVNLLNSGIDAITSLFGVSGGVLIQNNEARGDIDPNALGNTAADLQGGGGLFNNGGTLSVNGATIRTNTATGATFGSGGGLLSVGGTVSVTDTTIVGNTAVRDGGGLLTAGGTVNVSLSAIDGNAAGRAGGGVENALGTTVLTAVTVGDVGGGGNTANVNGGGVHVSAGQARVIRSTVNGNIAVNEGGGLWTAGVDGLVVLNSTVSGNTAGATGGGIHVDENATATITASTVEANSAGGAGDGIFVAAGASVTSTASVYSHQNGGGTDDVALGAGATISGDFNFVQESAAAITGTGNLGGVAPGLGPLADNGGPTLTHLPLSGSLLIDAVAQLAVNVDQIGTPRPQGLASDIGSVEVLDLRPSLVALSGGTAVVVFDADDPSISTTISVSGLQPGEQLVGIDRRPDDGLLYGVTDQNRIVRIDIDLNANTATAVFVSAMTQGLNDLAVQAIATARNLIVDWRGLFENFLGRNEKWLRGDLNSFGNPWYFITPEGGLFAWDGTSLGLGSNRLLSVGTNAWENPELIVEASAFAAANPAQLAIADQARRFFRSSVNNFFFNAFGGQEKWIKGAIAQQEFGNPWYFILPNGSVFAWDGSAGLNGIQVAAITPDVDIYEDPSLLFDAFVDVGVDSNGLDDQLHFFFDRSRGQVRRLTENALGADEKWFRGELNSFGNPWYFLLPGGELVAWNGTATASGNVLADLGVNAWNNIELVVGDTEADISARADAAALADLDFDLSLFRDSHDVNFFFNALGQQEKWLRGEINSFGNPWYLLLPNGSLVEWNGSASASGNLLATVSVDVYEQPLLLANAYADGSVLDGVGNFDPFDQDSDRPGDRLGDTQFQFGTDFAGVDFDPTTGGGLRIVTSNDLNLSVDIDTGLTALGTDVTPAIATLVAAGFTNNVAQATTTTLYVIDAGTDTLQILNPATGTLTLVGALGVDTSTSAGLEIVGSGSGDTGTTLAVLTVGGQSRLFEINLATGAATDLGLIGAGFSNLNSVALAPSALDDLFADGDFLD